MSGTCDEVMHITNFTHRMARTSKTFVLLQACIHTHIHREYLLEAKFQSLQTIKEMGGRKRREREREKENEN